MLERILGSRTKVRILRTMIEQDRESWLGELARSTGLSFGTLHPALQELADARVLRVRRVGRSALYDLNRDHLLFNEVRRLFSAERERPSEVAQEFARRLDKAQVRNIIMFGSAARGEFDEGSDIDILIVHEGGPEGLADRARAEAEHALEERDIVLSLTFLSCEELKARLERLDAFAQTALDEGRVLFGELSWLRA